MAKKTYLEETDLPMGVDLTDEAPVNTPQAKKQSQPSQAAQQQGRPSQNEEYAPRQDVLDRLNSLPKDEIKKEIGLDIDYLIRTARSYGTLEALAFGSYTKPVDLVLKTDHGAKLPIKGTVRLYAFADGEWFYEIHPVTLKNKLDKDGKQVYDADGLAVKTYDRNPITKDEVDALRTHPEMKASIEINGKPLSADQMDRLRLTGNLGDAVNGTNKEGKKTTAVYSVDPYNNHCLCSLSENTIIRRLSSKDSFTYTDAQKQTHTIPLTEKMKGELALGHGVWGTDDQGKDKYLQYNAAKERLELSVEYEYALKRERSQEQGVVQQQAQVQTQSTHQEVAPAKGVGASL